jgi:hypothetical protein
MVARNGQEMIFLRMAFPYDGGVSTMVLEFFLEAFRETRRHFDMG